MGGANTTVMLVLTYGKRIGQRTRKPGVALLRTLGAQPLRQHQLLCQHQTPILRFLRGLRSVLRSLRSLKKSLQTLRRSTKQQQLPCQKPHRRPGQKFALQRGQNMKAGVGDCVAIPTSSANHSAQRDVFYPLAGVSNVLEAGASRKLMKKGWSITSRKRRIKMERWRRNLKACCLSD